MQLTDGIHVAGGPAFALDYDSYIAEAKEMFVKLYPDEEFLPRAPEPEEIVMEGYEDVQEEKEDSGDQPTTTEEEKVEEKDV